MPPTAVGGEAGSGGGQQMGQRSAQVPGDQVLSFDVIVSKSVTEAAEFLRTAQMGIDRQKEDLAQREAEIERRMSRLMRRERRFKMHKKKIRRAIREIQSVGISLDSSGSEKSDASSSSSESSHEFARKPQKKRPAGRSRTPVMNRRPTKKRKMTNETTGTTESRKTDSSVTATGPCEGEGSPGVVDPAVQQEEREAKAAGSFSSENGKVFWNKRSRAWIASWKDEANGSWRTKSFNPRTKYDGNVQSARDDAIVFLTERPKVKSPASSDPTKKEGSSGCEEDEEEEEEEHDEEIQAEMVNGEDGDRDTPRRFRDEIASKIFLGFTREKGHPLLMYLVKARLGKRIIVAERNSRTIDLTGEHHNEAEVIDATWVDSSKPLAATNDGRVVECSLVSSSSSSSDESPNRRSR